MTVAQKPKDVWSVFALSVFRLNGLIMQAGENIAQPVGQSSARWQVLGRAFEAQTVAAIARSMGQSRQNVQRIANVLATEGLVAFRDHPTDRRTRLVELTPQGLDVLRTIYTRQLAWSEQVTAIVHPDELAKASSALDHIGDVLEARL